MTAKRPDGIAVVPIELLVWLEYYVLCIYTIELQKNNRSSDLNYTLATGTLPA